MTNSIIEDLINIVQDRIYEYSIKYKTTPKFVKIPLWIYYETVKYNKMVRIEGNAYEIMGLKVCETPTITDIKEVEVF